MTDTETIKSFEGLNQAMATVVAKAANELTAANILWHLLSEKNPISEYFKSKSDYEAILTDLAKEHDRVKDNPENIKATLKCLRNISANRGNFRYVDEAKFLEEAFNRSPFKQIMRTIMGKYIRADYIREDIRNMIPNKPIKEWETNRATILEMFGRNLTKAAAEGELNRIVGREEEIHRVIQVLTRQTKSNPVLVGEAGVGKTAIAEKLADILHEKTGVPTSLHDSSVYELNLSSIIAAASAPGALEDIFESILQEAARENAIIFIDEIHRIQQYSDGKIANILKPAMARGELKLLGATTEDEYKVFEHDKAMTRRFQPVKVDAPDKTTVYRILKTKADEAEEFHNVIIPDETLLKAITLSERYLTSRQQPDKAIDLVEEASSKLRMTLESTPESITTLREKLADAELEKEMLEVKVGDDISPREQKKLLQAKEKIAGYSVQLEELNVKYAEQRKLFETLVSHKDAKRLMEKDRTEALHLGDFEDAAKLETSLNQLNETIASLEKEVIAFAESSDEKLVQNVVVPDMVSRVIETITGIPVSAQDAEDIEKYRNIEVSLQEKVHGQERAINIISAAIKRSKAGLGEPNKPIGSFLALGPTGVGKTYFAQKLAEFMFDTEKVLHRFDMSEYKEPHAVARLFGSPPGYVGHNEGGQLTEIIKRNPYSILLFDEFEKAHKNVFDTLLQVLDAGRMTDGKGNTVDFRNTIIIMTSNIGSDIIRQGIEKGYDDEVIESALLEELASQFRPEFLNRFDAKVMFSSLKPDVVIKIADSELKKLADRLQEDMDIELYWGKSLPAYITNAAYSVTDGARPIKRFINDAIVDIITNKILDGEIEKGNTIYIAIDNDDMVVFPADLDTIKNLQEEDDGSEIAMATNEPKPSGMEVFYKVDSKEIVDADLGEKTESSKNKASKATKKKKKKKKKDTWDLNPEAGE